MRTYPLVGSLALVLGAACAGQITGSTSSDDDEPSGPQRDAPLGSNPGPGPGPDGGPDASEPAPSADARPGTPSPDAAEVCSGPEPLASDGPWRCDGLTGSTTNPNGTYYTTSFGCWVDEAGNAHSDGGDNCIPACSLSTIGCSGMSGPECERHLNWYTADVDRFGCGTKLKVTNVDAGLAAILVAIDRGPNCSVENNVDFWVLDMSSRASEYFFGGPTSAGEHADVQVEVVPPSTPLGPIAVDACP